MPIRHFDIFTAERRLIQTSAVSQLKDTRLGIEGNYWLRKILAKEPAVSAMGGSPLKLRETIEAEIKSFKANNIQPIFVFPGLSILRKDKPFSNEDRRPSVRATGWEYYDKNRVDVALGSWSNSGGVHPADLLNQVFHILHEHGVEFMRAPYSSWAQLAYMHSHPRQLVNAVYGGTELLMFDIDKVITTIDFEKGNYLWMSKKTVLQDLHVSDEQFLDICLLAGFEYCTSFPPLNVFTFKDVHDLVKQHRSGFSAVQSYADDPSVAKSGYIDTFCRARCVVKYHPILTDEGEVRPLNPDNAPNDIHEFIGYRLPDELYYYLMRCLVGPQSINTLVSGVLIENTPLDNGETVEYRTFLLRLLNIRTQTLSLLSQPLHQFYQSRKVASYFWFDPTTEHIMHHHQDYNHTHSGSSNFSPKGNASPLNTVYDATRSWHVTHDFLDAEKKAQKTDVVDIAFCIKATENEATALKTVTHTPAESDSVLEQKDEIVANILWKTLEIRDFLTSTKHVYTPWGRALGIALSTMSDGKDQAPPMATQEAYLTALELIRFEVLTNKPYSKSYSKIAGNENEQRHIRLISRTLSLLPVEITTKTWREPFDRDLLVFNSFVKALNRSYRNLCEMLVLSLFLNSLVEKERKDYFEIADSLPYASDVNVAGGLIAKHYLEHMISDNASSQEALSKTESVFTSCGQVKADLERGFRFWQGLVLGIKAVKDSGDITEDTYKEFLEADQWLQKRNKL